MIMAPTFFDAVIFGRAARFPLIREVAAILGGSLLIALSARVQAPTWPVPITLQPFAVLLVGAALGSRRGALAVMTYLAQGAAGLPVFALPPYGGLAYFAGPTAGYLLGFAPAACVVGLLAERGWDRRMMTTCAAMAVGQTIILLCGFAWMAGLLGASGAWSMGVAPFLAGDLLKILLAAVALPSAWRFVRRFDVAHS